MGRTLLARLPRLLSPLEKSHSCRFGIIWGVFLLHIENGILYVLIRGDGTNSFHFLENNCQKFKDFRIAKEKYWWTLNNISL